MSRRNKVFATDFEAWNHPLRAKVLLPFVSTAAFILSESAISHVVESGLLKSIGTIFFGFCIVVAGIGLLALVD
ncbi:hypothetical protein [Halorussus amylolyticus]|uniref:hypothetical protein n=1 Tax=Halorussus amylolyticus TaxID=1126242 RepID=UPI00104A1576|nr:hypothetical protein [Halorussus amylolyticus]